MDKYLVTIPLSSDLDADALLEAAHGFAEYVESLHGGRTVQDEEETAVESK
jgi:hypothetical protein